MQGLRIGKAHQGGAECIVERDRRVVAVTGDRHILDVGEAPGADIDSIAIALAEVIDVIVAATRREDEGVGARQLPFATVAASPHI
jgi:hypothetical protein